MLLRIIYRIRIGETPVGEEPSKINESKTEDSAPGKGVGARLVFFSFAFHIYVDDESG